MSRRRLSAYSTTNGERWRGVGSDLFCQDLVSERVTVVMGHRQGGREGGFCWDRIPWPWSWYSSDFVCSVDRPCAFGVETWGSSGRSGQRIWKTVFIGKSRMSRSADVQCGLNAIYGCFYCY